MIRSFWGLNFQVVPSISVQISMMSAGPRKTAVTYTWSLVAKKYLVFFPCWTGGRTASDGDDDDNDDDGDDDDDDDDDDCS